MLFYNLQKLHVEHQSGIGRDGLSGTTLAISQVVRDEETELRSLGHELHAFRPAGYYSVEGEHGRLAATVRRVEHVAVGKRSFVMTLHAVGCQRFCTVALFQHRVLQSAGKHCHALFLRILRKETLAFFANSFSSLFLLLLHKGVYEFLSFFIVDFRGLACYHIAYCLCKILTIQVCNAHAFEIMANDHSESVTEFIHKVLFGCIFYISDYQSAKVQFIFKQNAPRMLFFPNFAAYIGCKKSNMKKLVVLTGAGISAESGFSTFRDAGGLWEQYPVEKVATPEGWQADPNLVTDFYNGLRQQLVNAKPNRGHELLAEMEREYDVTIVTQNVDDLHERAGSTHVIHLHGELMKVCSSADPDNPRHVRTLPAGHLNVAHGERAADGSLLRPWIVWFGEGVPNLVPAAEEAQKADVFVIIGSSLNVYPAAGLVRYVRPGTPVYLIDPKEVRVPSQQHVEVIQQVASKGVATLWERLRKAGA